jgi:hypothetical protein
VCWWNCQFGLTWFPITEALPVTAKFRNLAVFMTALAHTNCVSVYDNYLIKPIMYPVILSVMHHRQNPLESTSIYRFCRNQDSSVGIETD